MIINVFIGDNLILQLLWDEANFCHLPGVCTVNTLAVLSPDPVNKKLPSLQNRELNYMSSIFESITDLHVQHFNPYELNQALHS